MTQPGRIRLRDPAHLLRPPHLCTVAAAVAFGGSMLVIAFGVIVTSGTYGSRLAWFLGVAVPVLALSALLAWLPTRRRPASGSAAHAAPGTAVIRRVVFVGTLVLVGAPAALAAMLLTTYGVFFVAHGISVVV